MAGLPSHWMRHLVWMVFLAELAAAFVWFQDFCAAAGFELPQLLVALSFMTTLYLAAPLGAWFMAGNCLASGDLVERVREASRGLGLARPVAVHAHERAEANTVGLLSSQIRNYVTTAMVDRLSDEQLRAILAHEALHVRERHILAMLGAAVVFAASSQVTRSVGVFLVGFLGLLAFRRWLEYRADAGAAEAVGTGPAVAALAELQEIYPPRRFDRWVMFLTPHPTLPVRIEALQSGRWRLL